MKPKLKQKCRSCGIRKTWSTTWKPSFRKSIHGPAANAHCAQSPKVHPTRAPATPGRSQLRRDSIEIMQHNTTRSRSREQERCHVQTYPRRLQFGCVVHSFPTRTTWTSNHGTEQRIDDTSFSHKLHEVVSTTYILKDQVLLASNGVDHECVVARIHFEKDTTSCNVCAAPSFRDKAKRHLSQLIDMSMLQSARDSVSTSISLASPWKSKLTTYSMHFANLPSEPSAVPQSTCRTTDFETHVGDCSDGKSYQRSQTFFMSVAFYKWLSLFSVPFSPGETTSMDCRGWHASARSDSNLQLWSSLVRTEALAYRAIAHVQQLARPLFADENVFISRTRLGRSRKTCLLTDCKKPTRNFVCLAPAPPGIP